MKNILIINDGQSSNLGDRAILQAMLSTISFEIKDVAVETMGYRPRLADLKKILWADVVVFGGGQSLHDQTTFVFVPYVAHKVFVAMWMGKKICVYGMGIGPVKYAVNKAIVKKILNRAKAVCLRDEISRKIAMDLGVCDKNIFATADIAFLLESTSREQSQKLLTSHGVQPGKKLVAICPRRWFHYYHGAVPAKYKRLFFKSDRGLRRFELFKSELAQAADKLIDRGDVHVVFLPTTISDNKFDPGQDDHLVCREISSMMKNDAPLVECESPQQLKGVIGEMDLVISQRMHSLIHALSLQVNCIGISLNHKFDDLLTRIGLSENLIDISKLSCRRIFDMMVENIEENRVKRQQVLTGIDRLKELAKRNNTILQTVLSHCSG